MNNGGISILSRDKEWGELIKKYTTKVDRKDVTDYGKVAVEFWEIYNKPFLDDAINRGDNIRFVSDPTLDINKYVMKGGEFVLDVNGNKLLSMLGREAAYLESKGYEIINGVATKK